MQVRSLDQEDPLEEGMATHSRILAWRIPVDRKVWWARVMGKEMTTHSSVLAWRIPMDRGAWWAAVHGVAKSRSGLSD